MYLRAISTNFRGKGTIRPRCTIVHSTNCCFLF